MLSRFRGDSLLPAVSFHEAIIDLLGSLINTTPLCVYHIFIFETILSGDNIFQKIKTYSQIKINSSHKSLVYL